MVKQVIVVRKDLNMRKGKISAQVAHAAMKVFFSRIENIYLDSKQDHMYKMTVKDITIPMKEWIEETFTKVVVGVESEEEIYKLASQAEAAGIPTGIIVDNGFTEFHGNKTTTCVAIGPAESDKIDQITKHLKLL